MPIAVYHFHKAGLYGALANIVAIPWTTFIAMPLEMIALLLEPMGLGGPVWWCSDRRWALLLKLAMRCPPCRGRWLGALPVASGWAFALAVAGGLWIALWRTRWRWLGTPAVMTGLCVMLIATAPDLVVRGTVAMPGSRWGMAWRCSVTARGIICGPPCPNSAGTDAEPLALADQPAARCGRDMCVTMLGGGGRRWRIAATRSGYPVPWTQLVALCGRVDIMIADRRLPVACQPRWLKLDSPFCSGLAGCPSARSADGADGASARRSASLVDDGTKGRAIGPAVDQGRN